MEPKFCQSCGMPLDNSTYYGTNADGSKNEEYCCYCFKEGKFLADCTMEEMIDYCVKYLDEFNGACNTHYTAEEAKAQMMQFFPQLKRWKK